MRIGDSMKFIAGFLLCCTWSWMLPGEAFAKEKFPEEAAQEKYLRAMSLYDNGEYDAALTQLGEARKEAKSLRRTWRKNVLKVIDGAEIGFLYEAGLAHLRVSLFRMHTRILSGPSKR